MKPLKWMAFFSILLLFPISSYAALDIMSVSLLEGEVQIYTEETGEWVPASINMPIKEGDRIWAADRGRVELHFKDGTYLRLDQTSALEVLNWKKIPISSISPPATCLPITGGRMAPSCKLTLRNLRSERMKKENSEWTSSTPGGRKSRTFGGLSTPKAGKGERRSREDAPFI